MDYFNKSLRNVCLNFRELIYWRHSVCHEDMHTSQNSLRFTAPTQVTRASLYWSICSMSDSFCAVYSCTYMLLRLSSFLSSSMLPSKFQQRICRNALRHCFHADTFRLSAH